MSISVPNNYNNVPITYEPPSGLVSTDGETTRFSRELVEKQAEMSCSFGTPLKREELLQQVDKEVQSNQDKKLTLEEMVKNSYVNATNLKYSFVGEDTTYSFYEYIDELKNRSEAMNTRKEE